jgi:hypothetical protein
VTFKYYCFVLIMLLLWVYRCTWPVGIAGDIRLFYVNLNRLKVEYVRGTRGVAAAVSDPP